VLMMVIDIIMGSMITKTAMVVPPTMMMMMMMTAEEEDTARSRCQAWQAKLHS
jgi:hypothetical protein